MFNWHVVSAVFWRNVKQYFSGPLGYLFIVVFVTVCAVMAFSPQFFADNQATLDQLNRWFPLLLLFFIPAITMTVWADEKRQGTDAILFTLPASDFDILLGKYLSVAAVYTVALLFSSTQVAVLENLGNPDWGILASTYLGYWLAGLSLLAVGMFASSLTGSATVAFVLGAILCAAPVLIGRYARGFVGWERLGFDWNLRDFTLGLIPLTNVLYFVALTIFMLYLNLIVISKRHWSRGEQVSLGGQFFVRAISLAVALISIGYLASTAISSVWSRADLTAERLYTLDSATVRTLDQIKTDDRSVTIQAFTSKEVPSKYVNVKKQFVGLLRQFSEYGGGNVTVRFVDVEPNSTESLDAINSGIVGINDRSDVGGRMVEQKVFLGATISSSLGDATVPSITEDSAIEYELTRALAKTVDKKNQIVVGVLDTDAHFGGPEIQGQRLEREWIYSQALLELRKQFDVKIISPEDFADYVDEEQVTGEGDTAELKQTELKTPPNVLLVADPSSLDDLAMDRLVKYVNAGNPTILMVDPLPFFWAYQYPIPVGVVNAPKQPRVSSRSPYAPYFTSSVLPKSDEGRAKKILDAIGVTWDHGATAWGSEWLESSFKPEGPFGRPWSQYYGPAERAFVFARSRADFDGFNSEQPISAGLKTILMFYPGSIKPAAQTRFNFEPLVKLSNNSGSVPWEVVTQTPTDEARMLNPRTGKITTEKRPARSQLTEDELKVLAPSPPSLVDDEEKILAARVTGQGENQLDVVVISDLDFVSNLAFEQEQALNDKLDNLALLQNSIEILAGNEGFVSLRNRRPTPRTLEKLENTIKEYRLATVTEQDKAEQETKAELAKEQAKLEEANAVIDQNAELGFFEKLQKQSQEASVAQKRFDLKKKRLDRELKAKLAKLTSEQQQKISWLEQVNRFFSIFVAPLPALLLGVVVLWFRKLNEEKNISPQRRA